MDTLHLTEKIKMTKVIMIIIAVIGLLAFAYFTRIEGYREMIQQFSSYLPLDRPNSLNPQMFYTRNTKPHFN